jgi:hypothetical protein
MNNEHDHASFSDPTSTNRDYAHGFFPGTITLVFRHAHGSVDESRPRRSYVSVAIERLEREEALDSGCVDSIEGIM